MPDDLTFADLVDYLADHKRKKVYVEIGMHDREGPENASLYILKLHGYRLGRVQDAADYRDSSDRRGVMVWLERQDSAPLGEDETPDESTRFFITPDRVTRIEGDPARGLKVWLDDAVYLSLS